MNTSANKGTCLLIASKSFYFYSTYLKNNLTAYGYQVAVCNDEYPDNFLGKILGKLQIPLLLDLTQKKIYQKFIKNKSYDLVIVIKGRGVSESLVKQLRRICPRVIGYSFDSFKYHPAPLHWMTYMDEFYTFDYRDSLREKIPVIELFSSVPEHHDTKTINYEVSAIVRNHSDRLKFIDKVFTALPTDRKFIYIFEQNIFSFLINIFKNPFLYFKYRKCIFFSPLPYEQYCKVLKESNFTIDFAHPGQSGITMRCFEALSAQTKIITNNSFVWKNEHFNSSNTIIYDKNDSTFIEDFKKLDALMPAKYHRSISNFVEELIA